MDVNAPIENPELIVKIQDYTKSQSDKDENALRAALLHSKFLAPVNVRERKDGAKREQVLQKDTRANLINIEDSQHCVYLPAFTDWSEVIKWNEDEEMKTAVFTLQDYARIIANNQELTGIVINPYGENLVLDRETIGGIVLGKRVMKKGEPVATGLPQDYPEQMVQALTRYFDKSKIIKCAYLLWMVRNEEQSYLLVLDSNEDLEEIYPKIGDVCKPHLHGKFVDMVPLCSSLGTDVTKNHQPFYEAEM